MLTLAVIRMPERVAEHFAPAHRDGGAARPETTWFGKGAALEGLRDSADPADPERSYAVRIADVPDTPPNGTEPTKPGATAGPPIAASTAATTLDKEGNGTVTTPATEHGSTPIGSSVKAAHGKGKGGC